MQSEKVKVDIHRGSLMCNVEWYVQKCGRELYPFKWNGQPIKTHEKPQFKQLNPWLKLYITISLFEMQATK